ncbi:MAG: SOS response-associated peptidase [bacterium]|nr:SOS response-associated peptidase [bacterium]
MCGRFTLSKSGSEIAAHFDLRAVPALAPRYNVAPGQDVAVVRLDPDTGEADGERQLELRRWGLLPGWAKQPNDGPG